MCLYENYPSMHPFSSLLSQGHNVTGACGIQHQVRARVPTDRSTAIHRVNAERQKTIHAHVQNDVLVFGLENLYRHRTSKQKDNNVKNQVLCCVLFITLQGANLFKDENKTREAFRLVCKVNTTANIFKTHHIFKHPTSHSV